MYRGFDQSLVGESSSMLRMETELMAGQRINQNSNILGQKWKNKELDKSETLHRAEGDCRVGKANHITH